MRLQRPVYDARTYTLTQNVAVTLPPARKYLLLSATADVDAVSIALGDGNGDPGRWPFGIEIEMKDRLNVRLVSTAQQSVTILLVDGPVDAVDNRGPAAWTANGASSNGPTLAARATSSTIIIPSATNVRGVEIKRIDLSVQATVANGGNVYIAGGGIVIMSAFAPAGVLQIVSAALDQPVFIPAGNAVSLEVVAAVALQVGHSIAYKAQ